LGSPRAPLTALRSRGCAPRLREVREALVAGASQGAGGQGVSHWASAIEWRLLPAKQPRGATWAAERCAAMLAAPSGHAVVAAAAPSGLTRSESSTPRSVHAARTAPRNAAGGKLRCDASTPTPCAPAGPGQGGTRRPRWCDGEARWRRTHPPTRSGADASHYPPRAHPADEARARQPSRGV
jgi:hypothetical protein